MALSEKDKKDIGEVVGVKITKEIGFLRLEMNQHFAAAKIDNQNEHQQILKKIEEIKKMESEDIQALADDITLVKRKIGLKTT